MARVDYLYEPSPQQIFDTLLPRHVEFQVYRALLESVAAENAAQMVAMDNATKNSAEVIDSLTLYMNKVRQAAITREIIEVVSGRRSAVAGRSRPRRRIRDAEQLDRSPRTTSANQGLLAD